MHSPTNSSCSLHYLDRTTQGAGVGLFGSLGAVFGGVWGPERPLEQHQGVIGVSGTGLGGVCRMANLPLLLHKAVRPSKARQRQVRTQVNHLAMKNLIVGITGCSR